MSVFYNPLIDLLHILGIIPYYDKVVTGIDSGDNMAKAGDAHKVYLTFDGGPDENTDKILDVLDKYGVKATLS